MEENRENVFIANKIYNDVLKFLENEKGFSSYILVKKFKIGYGTANIIINKLFQDEIIEEKYGTYWVIKNK